MSIGTTWGILGGGFGLYGYLPALAVRTSGKIHTLERYRAILLKRPDIQNFVDRVTFEPDAGAVLAHCNAIVIALRPADQESLLMELLDQKWMGKLILEKPLAPTPERALALLQRLAASDIVYRIGFTLGVTAWSAKVSEYLADHKTQDVSLDFQWRFLAHHYRSDADTWKRSPSHGGGATRFYAIHLIALLADWGIDTPLSFNRMLAAFDDEPRCEFAVTDGRKNAAVYCDSRWLGEPSFSIRVSGAESTQLRIAMNNPFDERSSDRVLVQREQPDPRVMYLVKILDTLEKGKKNHSIYMRHVRLWQELEAKSSRLSGGL